MVFRPRLESVYFGEGQYPRLARVLDYTARTHCPGWDVRVRRLDGHTLRAASGSESHAHNHHKLQAWCAAVRDAPHGTPILLVDTDTFVVAPLDPLWDTPFAFAYTVRAASKYPLNGGVVAVRAGHASRALMEAWLEKDALFLRDAEAHRPWRMKYGGINQASLGAVLETGGVSDHALVVGLPCLEWNCEDTCWERFGPATRVVHVKSALRMAVFGIASAARLRPLVAAWRRAEQAAEAEANTQGLAPGPGGTGRP